MNRIMVGVACFVGFVAVAGAQEKKGGPGLPPGDTFFTVKGQPGVLERTFPGIVAALELDDQQRRAIAAARAETVDDGQLRAGAGLKSDPAATDAKRAEVRKGLDDARARLKAKVDEILTAEQRERVAKIQAAADEAQRAAAEAMREQFAGAKGNDARATEVREMAKARTREEFEDRLERFLTGMQMAAIREAAIDAREAEDRAAQGKKGK